MSSRYLAHDQCILQFVHAGVLEKMMVLGWAHYEKGATVCHFCIKQQTETPSGDTQIVNIHDEMISHMCGCETELISDYPHDGHDLDWMDEWWRNPYPCEEGDNMYYCGVCYYEKYEDPPENRRENDDGYACRTCAEVPSEIIRVDEAKVIENNVREYDEDDEDEVEDEYEDVDVELSWTRKAIVTEYYRVTLSDLDKDEIKMLHNDVDGGFRDMMHDVAHDESESQNKIDSEWYDWVEDECPEDLDWEVV